MLWNNTLTMERCAMFVYAAEYYCNYINMQRRVEFVNAAALV